MTDQIIYMPIFLSESFVCLASDLRKVLYFHVVIFSHMVGEMSIMLLLVNQQKEKK